MRRRSFISKLVSVGSGMLVAPTLFLPKADNAFKWKQPRWIPNPDWVNADMEMMFGWPSKAYFGKWEFVFCADTVDVHGTYPSGLGRTTVEA